MFLTLFVLAAFIFFFCGVALAISGVVLLLKWGLIAVGLYLLIKLIHDTWFR